MRCWEEMVTIKWPSTLRYDTRLQKTASINPAGEWNQIRIIVDGNKVEHWLNDEKILDYDRKSLAFRELVSQSKYKDLENFGELERGRILLQGHGNDVAFRAIRIRTW